MRTKRAWTLMLCLLMSAGGVKAQAMRGEIIAADRALFAAVFDACDADAVGARVTDDFEFFHDKWGQIAKSKDEFVAAIGASCDRQRQGTDFRARRELVLSTLRVHPMQNYGALQTGQHAFFRIEKDGRLTPTEHARFTHLWMRSGDRWLLARVISYDHVDGPLPQQRR
jgi:ketosteroid isomerase-like protein